VNADILTAYRLTPMQELMLVHSVGAPGSDACFVQYSLRVEGPFDPERYRAAWQQLTDRHAALRTCFAWRGLDEPLQVVLAGAPVPLTELDWRDCGDDLDARLAELAGQESRQGFTLTAPPLLRLVVVRLPDERWHILIGLHHLVVDGWSVEQLLREAAEQYRSPAPDGDPAPDFGDYVAWLDEQDPAVAEAYWRGALEGLTPGAGRPGALQRPARPDGRAELREVRWELDAELADGLRTRARAARVTLSTLVRGAWGLLLARYAGTGEAVFAVTVAGRPPELPDAGATVGPFLNNVPVRVGSPAGDLTAWLAGLQREQARMDAHQWCSPAQIQRWSGQDSARALCDSLLVFQNYPGDAELPDLGPGTRLRRWRTAGPSVRTGFPLTLTVTAADTITVRAGYDSTVLSKPGLTRLGEEFTAVLTALAEGADELPLPAPWTAPAEDTGRTRRLRTPVRPPRTPLEERITAVFAEVLEVDEVGADDHFFDAGGNSLAAVHLSWRLRRVLGVDLPMEAVFVSPTPAALAAALHERGDVLAEALPVGA
jgi:acyl carrier protein